MTGAQGISESQWLHAGDVLQKMSTFLQSFFQIVLAKDTVATAGIYYTLLVLRVSTV